MKKDKDGNLIMELEEYKMMLEDIVSGREETMWGVTLKPETKQMAKDKLREIEQMEISK